jgi:hypothetical protein
MMIRDIALAPPAVFSPAKRRGWFYAGMATASLLVVLSGFGPHLLSSRPVDLPPMSPRVIMHASLFFGWVLLFVAQTVLVSVGQTAIHRRLGVAATLIAATMAVSGPPLAVGLARRAGPGGTDPLVFFLVLLTDIVQFAVFVAIALVWRRHRELHKRLMLLAMIDLLPASVSRWPIAAKNPAPFVSGLFIAFLVAMLVNDLVTRRRPHPATIVGGLILFFSLPLRFAIAQTAAWHHFATWLIR